MNHVETQCSAGAVLLCLGLCPGANAALSVKAVATGADYNLALASDGTVWKWGQVPVQVSGITGVAAISAAGICHNLALKTDGTVWEWVVYEAGQSCNGIPNRSKPAQVSGLSGVVAVADGGAHSLALKTDGTVWQWSGQSAPIQVSGLTAVIAIAAGQAHSLAVKSDGTVWAWGNNWYGQLGDGTIAPMTAVQTPSGPVQVSGLTGVAAVAAGYGHSLALKRDGTVWAWGHNGGGQLGDGTSGNVRPTPVQVIGMTGVAAIAAPAYGSLAVRKDGTVWEWPGSGQLTPVQVNGLSHVVAVVPGLALKDDGTMWTWGGRGGDGTTAIQIAPRQIGGLTDVSSVAASSDGALALNKDGTVWQWSGQSAPIQVSGLNGVTAIATAYTQGVALKDDGTVWEWSGQSAPMQVSGLSEVVAVAAGGIRGLAAKKDGTVWEWSAQSAPVLVLSCPRDKRTLVTHALLRGTFSRSSRCAAPEPASFTCRAIVQPRRAAFPAEPGSATGWSVGRWRKRGRSRPPGTFSAASVSGQKPHAVFR
jgi:alpha-tubulin suppressor-like RCC1 family protein